MERWYIKQNMLYGVVYGHPRLEDGTEISTSRIVAVDYGRKKVSTVNTVYSLGTVHPRYYQLATGNCELMDTERLLGQPVWPEFH